MIRYNTSLLNQHLAPEISEFTICDAPDISLQHPEASHWLSNHFLNSVFRGTLKNKYRQYAFNQIFRAQVAFADYHEARKLTIDFLSKGKPDSPAIRIYFLAVARWESCLLNIQIFIDVMNKMRSEANDDEFVYKKNDNSREERVCEIANTVKHWGGLVFSNNHQEHDTIPLWLTNSGLKTSTYEISYNELANLISEVALVADELQDPKSFASKK